MENQIPSFPFSLLLTFFFAVLVLASLIVKLWLGSRQIGYVARHRECVPSTFTPMITLSAHRKAADYTITKTRFGLLELALSTAVLLGWTLLGGLTALNQVLLTWLGGGRVQQLALLLVFLFVGGMIDLPAALYRTFVIEGRFGFNKMTLALWLLDLLKSSLMVVAIGLPIAAMMLWLMSASGAWWWLWAWSVWMGFNLLLLLIYPTFIAPFFNKFTPLDDELLKTRVNALMNLCGFATNGLFVMDGSKRSAHGNAYFTGFGTSKRVVFFDTLLSKLSADEVAAVLAHELGHFKHKHIIKRIISMFGLSLLGFALLGWLSTRMWFYNGLGVQPNLNAPNDALALLLFVLALPVFGFFVAPLLAQLSRNQEFEADCYAVKQTSGTELASALLKLYEDNASTLTPDPLYVKFYYSHPPATERLARINAAQLENQFKS